MRQMGLLGRASGREEDRNLVAVFRFRFGCGFGQGPSSVGLARLCRESGAEPLPIRDVNGGRFDKVTGQPQQSLGR